MQKLALGTVQFGLSYGIANKSGQVTQAEIVAILAECRASGIDTLDTAMGYGDSEVRLGHAGVESMRVVTKLPALPNGIEAIEAFVGDSVRGALARLNIGKLHGLLLHAPADLLGPNGAVLYRALQQVKVEGLAEKIGISVYDPEEISTILSIYSVDLVQAPFNVLDQRLLASGWLQRLKDLGVEVHTRSAFLQGLLLMPTESRPVRFKKWAPLWQAWEDYLSTNHLTALQGSLGFVHTQDAIDRIVIGVDGAGQLREIIHSVSPSTPILPATLATADLELINPSNWGGN